MDISVSASTDGPSHPAQHGNPVTQPCHAVLYLMGCSIVPASGAASNGDGHTCCQGLKGSAKRAPGLRSVIAACGSRAPGAVLGTYGAARPCPLATSVAPRPAAATVPSAAAGSSRHTAAAGLSYVNPRSSRGYCRRSVSPPSRMRASLAERTAVCSGPRMPPAQRPSARPPSSTPFAAAARKAPGDAVRAAQRALAHTEGQRDSQVARRAERLGSRAH